MNLDQAVDILSQLVKPSTALDEFLHMDMSLIPAHLKEKYSLAIGSVYKMIQEGEISREEFVEKLNKTYLSKHDH